MGNKHSAGELHHEAKLAASKFESDELHILKKTWDDLAERNDGKGIDKEIFLQYFPLTGLLGDRLFAQFDVKGNGLIDMDEFVTGLAVCSRGSVDDKIHFIFNMYDTSHDNTVSKEELTTLLNQVPTSVLHMAGINDVMDNAYNDEDGYVETSPSLSRSTSRVASPEPGSSSPLTPEREESPFSQGDEECDEKLSFSSGSSFDSVDQYTNHDIVEKAFEECDLNHEGRLKYEEFKMWVQRTPAILDYLESILPFVGRKEENISGDHKQKEALPMMQNARVVSNRRVQELQRMGSMSSLRIPSTGRPPTHSPRPNSVLSRTNTPDFFQGCSTPPEALGRSQSSGSLEGDEHRELEEQVKGLIYQAFEMTHSLTIRNGLQDFIDVHYGEAIFAPRKDSQIYKEIISKEGFLWKKGERMHFWNKRWYLMSGNCMYYYLHKDDVRPKGVIFLTGCLIDKIVDESSEMKGYFGIELLHQDLCTGEHHKHDRRVVYCKSDADRNEWLLQMQMAAHVVPIERDYVIGKELGKGRFSTVCDCVNKTTTVKYAVKIIEKAKIEPEEKALLRTEIAVLKLVNHPNIIKMEGIYETRTHMYIVMEKLTGGELFERIVGRPRFTEDEAAKLIRPLLESVGYLHDLGIVHRDIKPENVLCGDNFDEVKIADFGLSKMVLPTEKMDTACGTLSYVAPEVLTMQGYGQEADLWSIGVILFLILCGKLPFDGANHDDIINATIKAEIRVSPGVWTALSEEARDLIKKLLHKDPKERISARTALRHPFIVKLCPHHHRPKSHGHSNHSSRRSTPKMPASMSSNSIMSLNSAA